jgi:Escherichia/Staphylococcus phage prohead protease
MIECRIFRSPELRATREGHISGHAAVFNEEYILWDDSTSRAVETVKPGTFSRAIREKQDVRALFNHEPNNLLGRTKSGTLVLKQDSVGLHFDVEPPNTQIGRDVYKLVKRGDLTGCSFGFIVTKETVTELKESGKIIRRREIEDVDLLDVGPVTYPAYTGTDVNARAMELRSVMFPDGVPASVLRLVPSFAVNAAPRGQFQSNADLDDDRAAILAEIDYRLLLAGFRPNV